MITLRKTDWSDLETIRTVMRAAFHSDEEAALAEALLKDSSAQPVVSLLAFNEEQAVGHILFTAARLKPECGASASMLAPLAVIPEFQKVGVGQQLVQEGLNILKEMGTDLVFVLGHPEYYPRLGFKPAGCLGFQAPYPIPEKNADAWMVQSLTPRGVEVCQGKVVCADAMNHLEYWQE